MAAKGKSDWTLRHNEAHAWMLWTNDLPNELSFLNWLAKDEVSHLERLDRESARREYAAARGLCRRVLAEYSGLDPRNLRFVLGKHGKPRIVGAGTRGPRFNLTHTKGLIVCLVSRAGDVGVDAENTARKVDVAEVAKQFFSAREWLQLQKLRGAARNKRFFEMWVLKEAYWKGRGDGLARKAGALAVDVGSRGPALRVNNWQLTLKHVGVHHVAAAAIKAPGRVAIRWKNAGKLFEAGIPVV
jgi:4'-phosphopantetheinyl transferase